MSALEQVRDLVRGGVDIHTAAARAGISVEAAEHAVRKGNKPRKKFDQGQIGQFEKMMESGATGKMMAETFGISEATVYAWKSKILKRNKKLAKKQAKVTSHKHSPQNFSVKLCPEDSNFVLIQGRIPKTELLKVLLGL